MKKKTIEFAANVLKEIKAEVNVGVIKDYHISKLCNIETARETGLAVVLTLSPGVGYHSTILEMWRKWLEAEYYVVSVSRNQLEITFNVMNRFNELVAWFEKQSEQESSQTNERARLYLVSDVLTWKDGIGQYLDDQRVQELSKRLCSKYAQKLYNPSNTGKDEQKSADKIEPRFKVGDWVVDNCGYVWKIEGRLNQFYILEGVEGGESRPTIDWVDKTFHLWTIQDAEDGDILACKEEILLFKSYSVQGRISLYCWYNGQTNNFHSKEVIDISLNKRHKIFPATKEQRDLLLQKMKEAGYEWDTKKKELKKKT